MNRSERDRILEAVRRLPHKQASVVILRYYLDLSEADIADTLGMARGSVKSHAHRALKRLSDPYREMILLKDIQGLRLDEIAAMLDLPLGTVKSRSNRARIELARAVMDIDPSRGEGAAA